MTPFIKKKEVKKDWYVINAENLAVGRLASFISKVLRGKNKSTFNPHIDNGDFVIVTNINKIKFTGKKFKEKKYFRHTSPGGIKEMTPHSFKEKGKTTKFKISRKECYWWASGKKATYKIRFMMVRNTTNTEAKTD